ncbi:MAG: phosphotransferase [bacterium]|nr:phosphotransferase [Candidatus Kapabacteria bacterium]
MSQLDGMVGYNINVANAIASIFVATGQDLGSLHESSVGVLNVERTTTGLYLSLNLPTLVIGTVGGGTHLPCQREALELMGCYGSGRLERFASLIAGFALSLEISTYAAIVSGQFAKAHEMLGRNKPKQWLLRSEIDRAFVEASLNGSFADRTIQSVSLMKSGTLDNGILMNLTSRISRRLCGFVPIKVDYTSSSSASAASAQLLLKIKPLDREVIEGLHFMAAAVNTELADLIYEYRASLEYTDCHTKEIAIYEILHECDVPFIPFFHGKRVDHDREIYLFVQELLDAQSLTHYNSENSPQLWDEPSIRAVVSAITHIHRLLATAASDHAFALPRFETSSARALYAKLIDLAADYHSGLITTGDAARMHGFLDELANDYDDLGITTTIIHNDFNPRNLAVRRDGTPCVYDWELCVTGIPHRDIVEFLCFSLEEGYAAHALSTYLAHHYSLYADDPMRPSWHAWRRGYEHAVKEFLVARVSFYLVGDIVTHFEFAPRIYANAMRMLDVLDACELVDFVAIDGEAGHALSH